MKELNEKLINLRVSEKLAEIELDNATTEEEARAAGKKIQELRNEIAATEAEIANSENAEEVTEETEKVEEVTEDVKEEVEEVKEEIKEAEEVTEDTEETETEVDADAETDEERGNWVKVEKRDLNGAQKLERGVFNMENNVKVEERAKQLIEGRAVTLASEGILVPDHTSNEIAGLPFRPYSSLADLVKIVNLQGGETYAKAYVKNYGTAGTTLEGEDYTTAETEFDDVTVAKAKLTVYAEISEELEKLPAADYEAEVRKGLDIAFKKKIAQQILTGAGSLNTFVGIFSTDANNKCVLAENDLSVAAIGADTLKEIIFNYGGDEDVEGVAVLILNKADLLAFAKVKDEMGRPVYKIDYTNRTIDGVPYIINSNCPALTATATAEDTYCMAYGVLQHYEVPVFSPVEVMKSNDYKFKQGIICYKGSVFMGGNTTGYKGFMRIKKVAAV